MALEWGKSASPRIERISKPKPLASPHHSSAQILDIVNYDLSILQIMCLLTLEVNRYEFCKVLNRVICVIVGDRGLDFDKGGGAARVPDGIRRPSPTAAGG